MRWAYYNEFDRFAAQWLRELIKRGLIADGEVDERSIANVDPVDLAPYRQCHFFAGIGVWSYALRQAGWPDDRPVWTGSCPCQPFSAAGKRKSHEDERHLWPVWFNLIKERRPDTVIGEQVGSRDGLAWLDAVCSDMEREGYAVGAVDIPACGFGAPHIRQRLYFVAESERNGCGSRRAEREGQFRSTTPDDASPTRPLDIPKRERNERGSGYGTGAEEASGRNERQDAGTDEVGDASPTRLVGNAEDADGGAGERGTQAGTGQTGQRRRGSTGPSPTGELADAGSSGFQGSGRPGTERAEGESPRSTAQRGPTNGFWADAVWIPCRDGKWRPAKSSIFPLADGTPGRVGLLRGAGNALVAPVATEFIKAVMEILK